MTTASANSTSSEQNLAKLRVDFYESGVGDTIIITFPNGGIGIVDAHPSPTNSRPEISTIVAGRKIHFVCLTHPHADHGVDLIPVLETGAVSEFWHTTSDIRNFVERLGAARIYRSPIREFAQKFNDDWYGFAIDLYGAVAEKDTPRHLLHAGLEAREIDGVLIHVLAPEETVLNEYADALLERIKSPTRRTPDPNILSAILAVNYGMTVVLLGADALQSNWTSAYARWQKRSLPKAMLFKVPHHGAKNSLNLGASHTYLDMCQFFPRASAVVFAGDKKHPDEQVYRKLQARTNVYCLANGLNTPASNPLGIRLKKAKAVQDSRVCQPVVSFEVDSNGGVVTLAGYSCSACPRKAATVAP